MAATAKKDSAHKPILRQFVVRLWQTKDPKAPGLYDRLLEKSLQRSSEEGRRVAMTELAREAIEGSLD